MISWCSHALTYVHSALSTQHLLTQWHTNEGNEMALAVDFKLSHICLSHHFFFNALYAVMKWLVCFQNTFCGIWLFVLFVLYLTFPCNWDSLSLKSHMLHIWWQAKRNTVPQDTHDDKAFPCSSTSTLTDKHDQVWQVNVVLLHWHFFHFILITVFSINKWKIHLYSTYNT